jgi:EAL domain-containing protein (putative c-di-GMP-specific phosphodiesterase class I)
MRSRILEEQQLIGDVRRRCRREQFEVFLQPQYKPSLRRAVGAEALVRWNHPTKGMIQPSSFIPSSKKRVITQLDIYFGADCKLLRRWRDEGLPQISVSSTFPAWIFRRRPVPDHPRLTEENGATPQELRLEITEPLHRKTPAADRGRRELQSKGFFIEMDDFGKGQSSLNALKNVPWTCSNSISAS